MRRLSKTTPKLESTLVAHSCWPKTDKPVMHLITKVRVVNLNSPAQRPSERSAPITSLPVPSAFRCTFLARHCLSVLLKLLGYEVWVSEEEGEDRKEKGEGRRRERG